MLGSMGVELSDGVRLAVQEHDKTYMIGIEDEVGWLLMHNPFGPAMIRGEVSRKEILNWLERNASKEGGPWDNLGGLLWRGHYYLFGRPVDFAVHRGLTGTPRTTEELARAYLMTSRLKAMPEEFIWMKLKRLFSWDEQVYKSIRAAVILSR